MSEPEALASTPRWADTRRRSPPVEFVVRYWLGRLLLWISGGCIALARIEVFGARPGAPGNKLRTRDQHSFISRNVPGLYFDLGKFVITGNYAPLTSPADRHRNTRYGAGRSLTSLHEKLIKMKRLATEPQQADHRPSATQESKRLRRAKRH